MLAPCVAEPTPLSIVSIHGALTTNMEHDMAGWKRKAKPANEFEERAYSDLMVDLETLGTDARSQVLSLGAVRFRLDTLDDIHSITDPKRNLYVRFDEHDQEAKGRSSDPDTVEWWANQSKGARQVFNEEREPTARALKRFLKFAKGVKRVWGNGNMFDNAIVRSLCGDYDLEYPVPYYRDLDVRTLTYLWNLVTNWGSKGKRPTINLGEEHNALDDARRQVLQCQIMYRDVKGSKYGA